MSSVSSVLAQIPGLTSTNVTEFVMAMIHAASKGIKVLITAAVYEKLAPLFKELGIEVREVGDKIPYDTYIIIKSAGGFSVKIEVVEAGKKIHTFRTTLQSLQAALREVLKRRSGAKEGPKYYEIVTPSDLELLKEEEDKDEE